MKTAFVTGGSGEIGRAICRTLAGGGYQVAIQYHSDEESARRLEKELRDAYGASAALAVACDIREEKQVDEAASRAEEYLGEIGLLVNNAGISRIRLFDEISLEEWNQVIGVNLTGTFLMTRRLVRPMIRAKEGCILNIASMWGQVGASCETHYSASKGGVIALTKALAQELGPSGIRVNCLCPGVIDTKMNGHLSPEEMDALKEEIPLGTLGTGEDIASMCLFLAEKAPYITGQVIGINGGMVL